MTVCERALRRARLLALAVLLSHPGPALAQSLAELRIDENFRRDPNGVVLGRLEPGTRVGPIAEDGNWTQIEVEGWVWLRSLQVTDQEGFDLVVSSDGGENLRGGPSGPILGRLEEGTLLEEVSRDPAWARVRRVGWVWSASLAVVEPSRPASPPPDVVEVPERSADDAVGVDADRSGRFARVGPRGGSILTNPDGDTLAVARADSDVEVIRREGNWARVRLEGWLWLPRPAEAEGPVEDVSRLDPAQIAGAPDTFTGRVVSWTLQFISLERAEAVRTDFFEGEPFLLTRYGGADGPFVYVAVTDEVTGFVEGLVPLERILVTGRVRTGSSALTGAVILDVVEIERVRGGG